MANYFSWLHWDHQSVLFCALWIKRFPIWLVALPMWFLGNFLSLRYFLLGMSTLVGALMNMLRELSYRFWILFLGSFLSCFIWWTLLYSLRSSDLGSLMSPDSFAFLVSLSGTVVKATSWTSWGLPSIIFQTSAIRFVVLMSSILERVVIFSLVFCIFQAAGEIWS